MIAKEPEVIYNDVVTTIQSTVVTTVNIEGLTHEEIKTYQRIGIMPDKRKGDMPN